MKDEEKTQKRRRPPAKTMEAREDELIRIAYNEAERRIKDGTATTPILMHFIKQGSRREKLEQESIRGKMELDKAKIKSLESSEQIMELYQNAIEAMTRYGRNSD